MKKFKKLYTLATLLVAGAAITACTSDDFADEGLAPQQGKTYTLSVNAMKGADTRTLIDEGTTLSATWNTTDVVLVYKGENKVGELTPDAATAKAKLTGEVTGVDVDDDLILKIGTPDNYATQKGTLEDIDANCNYAEATVKVTEIVGNAVKTSDAAFENKQAIVKIALKDIFGNSTAKTAAQSAVGDAVYPDGSFYTVDAASSTALSASKLIIKNEETNAVITTVTPNSAASELYVALEPCSALSLKFEATANDLIYKAYENVTVEAGKFYQPTLNLSAAEAVVVYKSTDLSKDILAYALEDACDPSPWNPDNINTWVANHPVTGGTWRLPSTEDFKYMFEGCGGTPFAAATNTGESYNYGTLQSLITAVGGKKVTEGDYGYWSSTDSGTNAYAFFFYNIDKESKGQFWAMYKSSYWYYYRACLAFPVKGFSVSATKQVAFALGNLQYVNGTWQFASHQYDYFGESQNENQRDLFSKEEGYTYSCPSPWRLLTAGTSSEWDYVMNTRSVTNSLHENARYSMAKIGDIKGMILFPDNYTHPEGTDFSEGTYNAPSDYTATVSIAGWEKMEAAGAIFLPAAGYFTFYNNPGGTYKEVGEDGSYFSESLSGSGDNLSGLYFSGSGNEGCQVWTNDNSWQSTRRAIRPVMDLN